MVRELKSICSRLSFALKTLLMAQCAFAQIVFEEVTESVGMSSSGLTFGASWGDFDGDGRPDIWVGTHGEDPRLYINTAGGQFELLPDTGQYGGDLHGAAWADFDNDGDQDLLILNGAVSGTGARPNRLLVNTLGQLSDKAQELGLDYPLGRGRTPLWFDWNNDGELDVLLANTVRPDGQAPSAIFTRREDAFVQDNALTGFSTTSKNMFAQLGWNHDIDRPLLMVHAPSYPEAMLRYDALPFQYVTEQTGFPENLIPMHDGAFRDFDGNGREDFFLLRAKNPIGSELANGALSGRLEAPGGEVGVYFSGGGTFIDFSFVPPWLAQPENIFIGAAGSNPDSAMFTLNVNDIGHHGIAAHDIADGPAIHVGYDPIEARWAIFASDDAWFGFNYVAVGEQDITSVTHINGEKTDGAQSDFLLLNIDGQLIDVSVAANLSTPTACDSVAAADFDNDMDIDLYLVCHGIVANRPNRLWVNQGDGTFANSANSAGAAGSVDGMGESVAVADYDLDGFIDIFVTNGRGLIPGPDQLFRNQGNSNNWLELDLVGVESNRDGIGARVEVVAGGFRQSRLADGGMHRRSQDHARLHFGLGENEIIDEIVVKWPGGSRQVLANIATNQILAVVECTGPVLLADELNTDRGGQPIAFDPLANDTCLDNTPITLIHGPLSDPAAGSMEVTEGTNRITLSMAAEFAGHVTFQYTVSDARGRESTAVVSVHVNDFPEAFADSATVIGGEKVWVDVLANDRGLSDGLGSVSITVPPENADSANILNGWLVYSAPEGFIGEDSLKYTITDSDGDSSEALVSIEISKATTAPADNVADTDDDSSERLVLNETPKATVVQVANGSALHWLTILAFLMFVPLRSIATAR
jgi:hypothetical protein